MARKSNKTAHVLNLLAGSENKNGIIEKHDGTIETMPKHPVSIAIVEASNSENDPVADVIKNQLLSELEDINITDRLPESPIFPEFDTILESEQELVNDDLSEEIPDKKTEQDIKNHLQKDLSIDQSPSIPEDTKLIDIVKDTDSNSGPVISKEEKSVSVDSSLETNPDIITIQKENKIPEPVKVNECDYEYLNVMEIIVKERIKGFMESFGMCTCSRCVIDTTALALTNLPPKYIVTLKNSASPLLNFYTSKFSTQVVAQLTKACVVVNEKPHH